MSGTAGTIVFYEKPGCSNNTRQKRLLSEAGANLEVRNLLTEPWTYHTLVGFFTGKPVVEWFNPSAPRIQSGEVKPDKLLPYTAILAMLEDPLLIRRPLIAQGGFRTCGFDWPALAQALGLEVRQHEPKTDLETCPRSHHHDHPPCHQGGAA